MEIGFLVKSVSENSLSNVYSIKLPYNGSCSGAGATIFLVNNDVKLVAGGGAGWSSELVSPPSFCNSQVFSSQNQPQLSKIKQIIPIKK